MTTPTVYSFGYWGWGTNTQQLVKLASTWEKEQGFKPPLWVDVRLQRQTRAPEFRGDAFAKATGPQNYRWMRGLGNAVIADANATGIKIKDPKQADELLDLILECHSKGQRVVYFCACELACVGGRMRCHRYAVGTLLLAAARRRKSPLTVVEWPGGEPTSREVTLDDRAISKLKGYQFRTSLLPRAVPTLMPQGSVIHFRGDTTEVIACLQTPILTRGEWAHRMFIFDGPRESYSQSQIDRFMQKHRKGYGLLPRTV